MVACLDLRLAANLGNTMVVRWESKKVDHSVQLELKMAVYLVWWMVERMECLRVACWVLMLAEYLADWMVESWD